MTADQLASRRQELLVRQLMAQLTDRQSLTYTTEYVEDLQAWRKAARIAGRRMGISIRTGLSRDGMKVWASEGP